jgi:hypothetical protein
MAAREQAGFDEAAVIDQVRDALARVEHALRLALHKLLRPAHRQCLGGFLLQLLQQLFGWHNNVLVWPPRRHAAAVAVIHKQIVNYLT